MHFFLDFEGGLLRGAWHWRADIGWKVLLARVSLKALSGSVLIIKSGGLRGVGH